MKNSMLLRLSWVAMVPGLLAGCAQTQVAPVPPQTHKLARPDRVYVFNYVVSPDEVQLDSGLTAKIEDLVRLESRTDAEKERGRQVSDALARHIVAEIQALGYEAKRATGAPPKGGTVLTLQGQLISIRQVNQAKHAMIGLAADRTNVKTITQVYDIREGTRTLASEFETDAGNAFPPTGDHQGSTELEADADRTAKEIVRELKKYFIVQGWILE